MHQLDQQDPSPDRCPAPPIFRTTHPQCGSPPFLRSAKDPCRRDQRTDRAEGSTTISLLRSRCVCDDHVRPPPVDHIGNAIGESGSRDQAILRETDPGECAKPGCGADPRAPAADAGTARQFESSRTPAPSEQAAFCHGAKISPRDGRTGPGKPSAPPKTGDAAATHCNTGGTLASASTSPAPTKLLRPGRRTRLAGQAPAAPATSRAAAAPAVEASATRPTTGFQGSTQREHRTIRPFPLTAPGTATASQRVEASHRVSLHPPQSNGLDLAQPDREVGKPPLRHRTPGMENRQQVGRLPRVWHRDDPGSLNIRHYATLGLRRTPEAADVSSPHRRSPLDYGRSTVRRQPGADDGRASAHPGPTLSAGQRPGAVAQLNELCSPCPCRASVASGAGPGPWTSPASPKNHGRALC